MKTLFFFFFGMFLFIEIFPQKAPLEPQTEDLKFIPGGSFARKVVTDGYETKVDVKVMPFWMSNEITNAEYKAFINYVKQHPEWEIYSFDKPVYDSYFDGSMINVKNRKILENIIDSVNLPIADYLTNPKYDDYPVVGVDHLHASYYCIWKTQMTLQKLEAEGKPAVHDYRLPAEGEWEFAARQTAPGDSEKIVSPSISGKANKYGLYNLAGNVAEWTSTNNTIVYGIDGNYLSQTRKKIVRGGSWKTGPGIDYRLGLYNVEKADYVGFRIVRTALEK